MSRLCLHMEALDAGLEEEDCSVAVVGELVWSQRAELTRGKGREIREEIRTIT